MLISVFLAGGPQPDGAGERKISAEGLALAPEPSGRTRDIASAAGYTAPPVRRRAASRSGWAGDTLAS